jgi:hypothetical protein
MNVRGYIDFDKIIYGIDLGIKTICFICISPLLIVGITFSPLIYYHLKNIEKEKKECSAQQEKYYEYLTKQREEEKQKEHDKLIEIIRNEIISYNKK